MYIFTYDNTHMTTEIWSHFAGLFKIIFEYCGWIIYWDSCVILLVTIVAVD